MKLLLKIKPRQARAPVFWPTRRERLRPVLQLSFWLQRVCRRPSFICIYMFEFDHYEEALLPIINFSADKLRYTERLLRLNKKRHI